MALTPSASTFPVPESKWRAGPIHTCDSSRLTYKRFPITRTPSRRLSMRLVCVICPSPMSRCEKLKAGGWMAFTVWDVPERAVGFGAVYAAIRAHGSLDVGLPVGPNFFLFSEAEHSLDALLRAGFVKPSFMQVPQAWQMDAPDNLFDMVAEGTARAAATLAVAAPRSRLSLNHIVR